ncbi:hypothetical protein TUBRATIS_19970 [Tubulinosema ratisbonensis]|uniref:Peptidase M48 domain-containing protein n=1 Tax=Tubulinosema ratisbonensis TaxID=291195 RepID=A0A437AK36_9MICR|nr:hypothetical protein TUBRATIS_19970 [Tubulinosema ratisbonensis]
MFLKIISGLFVHYLIPSIIVLYIIAIIKTSIEKKRIGKPTKSKTYDIFTQKSSSHLEIEIKAYNAIISYLAIPIFFYSLIFGFVLVSFYDFDTSQPFSFSYFFDITKKKCDQMLLPGYKQNRFLIQIIIYIITNSLIPFQTISYLIFTLMIRSDSFLDYWGKKLDSYDINIVHILLFFTLTVFLSLLVSYFYLFFLSMKKLKTVPEKCIELASKHFDYVGYIESDNQFNVMNGPIFHKQALLFLGDSHFLEEDELYAIILHEIGHGGNSRIHLTFLTNLIIKLIFITMSYYLSMLYTKEFFNYNHSLCLVFFSWTVPAVYFYDNILNNYLNYKEEFLSDYYAIKNGYGKQLISALIKLSYKNKMYNKLNYFTNLIISTHPCNYSRALFYDKIENQPENV